jgi:ABC-type phosphate transport system auxiliary subunit
MQVQAQKDADAAHQMKEVHARHASLRHSLKALHAAYTQLRLRLEDVVGHILTPYAHFVNLLMFLLFQEATVLVV